MAIAVSALRRYPVKAMGGESLDVAEIDHRGLVGDRWYAVEDGEGRFASGKTTRRFRRRDAVFAYGASSDGHGQVAVSHDGRHWAVGDPCLDRHLSEQMGAAVRVTPEAEVPHQDMGSVSIISTATLDWCARRWGGSTDPRRTRVNILVEGAEPFEEESWAGRDLELGSATLRVVERAPRCRTIDLDQDGAVPGRKWLRGLTREREMFLAVYADVRTPGKVGLGDEVRLR